MKHFDIEAIGRQEVITKKQKHVNVLFFHYFWYHDHQFDSLDNLECEFHNF